MTFISYAQNNEDVILWRALKNVKNGFYVDVGANDPVIDSVTMAFYEKGWRGINLEPMQSYFMSLCSARPRDINLGIAAADKAGELVFYEIPQTGLSTTNEEIAQRASKEGWVVSERKVLALALNEIFEKHVKGPIHFLKIDVEGAEDLVLKGLDLTRWRPWILIIEATIPLSEETNHENWEYMVNSSKYHYVYFDGLNRFYLSEEHIELAEYFKAPPNIFDGFMTISSKKMIEDRDRLKMELDNVYHSRSYRLTSPLRSIVGKLRLVREKAKNKLINIINIIGIEVLKHARLKKMVLRILNRLPALKSRIKTIIGRKTADDNAHVDLLTEKPESLSFKDQIIYNDLLVEVERAKERM